MKIHVQVVGARGLAAMDSNGLSDPFVRLQLGNTKARTSVVYRDLNPTWNEDFFFNVVDVEEELSIMVWDEDRFTDDFLGQVRIPVFAVLNADKQTLSKVWYPLQKRNDKSKTAITGEICLSLALFGREPSRRKTTPIASINIPPVMDESMSVSSIAEEEEKSLSRTSSMDSDSSTDAIHLVDVPVSPTMKRYPDNVSELNPDEDLVKEFDNHERRRRRNNKWKGDAQRVASKLSSVFKKDRHSRPGGSESPSYSGSSRHSDSSVSLLNPDASEASSDEDADTLPLSFFDDDGKSVGASPEEIPPPLAGGVVLDEIYALSAKAMNALVFKSGSPFVKDLLETQKSTDYVEEPWRKVGTEPIKRVVSYTKAASKLVKAVKATEVQSYTRADDKCFCVFITCATPDVPYGGNFVVEMQANIVSVESPLYFKDCIEKGDIICMYCEFNAGEAAAREAQTSSIQRTFPRSMSIAIAAGQDTPNGDKTCHLEISWRINFLHSTMMKGMIENGARTGIRESYAKYKEVLERHAKPISSMSSVAGTEKDDERPISDWLLAWDYFGKWHVLVAVLSLMFILLHISLTPRKERRGLEFWRIDFPDSLSELITSGLVALQVERVAIMVYDFVRARYWQSDHGIKAQGNGWLTTVTLVEGENVAPTDSGVSNPYVVFTCNGKTRTSSVKLRTSNPVWREIFEFNATEDPPSTMDVEVFDYDGPFSEAESLGHTEVNFLKQSPGDLSDYWIPLSGKAARANGSKLHLRVFLTNTRDGDALPEYLERVEREVGTKVSKRSAQRNSSFQKLFSLPTEEFLINDFACAIKRTIPIQGRLFLSPRLLGFYSNLFGHKTKFTLIWEDIEEIKETAQSINPSIVVFLRKGRGYDARHGARGIDGRGRLKFQFLSFVRAGAAFKTIIALWKNRNLSPEQQMEIIASVEAGDMKYAVAERQADDNGAFLGVEEANMSEVTALEIPITAESILAVLHNEKLDAAVNEKLGLMDYKSTPWQQIDEKPGVHQRQLSYSLNRQISQFGSKVSCIQQETVSDDTKKLVIDEILTLHDVPFGDHFQVHVRREIETFSMDPINGQVKAFVGVAWHKSTEFPKKFTKNIYEHMTKQIREWRDIIVEEVQHKNVEEQDIKVNGA